MTNKQGCRWHATSNMNDSRMSMTCYIEIFCEVVTNTTLCIHRNLKAFAGLKSTVIKYMRLTFPSTGNDTVFQALQKTILIRARNCLKLKGPTICVSTQYVIQIKVPYNITSTAIKTSVCKSLTFLLTGRNLYRSKIKPFPVIKYSVKFKLL